MLRPGYVILAHKRPDLLFRLVDALGDSDIGIHVDRKSEIWAEVSERAAARPNITLLPRHVCHWGGFGHVLGTLEGLKWARARGCDYAVLLTGQCYPIQSQGEILANMDALQGRSQIQTKPFPMPDWMDEGGGYSRIDRFYFKAPWKAAPQSLKLWTRRTPQGLHPHGGGSYWCLSRPAVDYVLDYLDEHPDVLAFFRTAFIPDEMMFHTLISNSPYRDQIANQLIHYTDWSTNEAHPAIIDASRLPQAMASGAWFARKFEDLAVLELVDRALEDRR